MTGHSYGRTHGAGGRPSLTTKQATSKADAPCAAVTLRANAHYGHRAYSALPRRPDFFIVGAPKCGTTALYEYLRVHPQIFMPFHKEPHFFGRDLTGRYGRISLDHYLDLFAPARVDQRAGEASSWYLYSESAAREIEQFAPAHIIIILRNPVDMMCAQHSQLIFNRQENIADFEQALAAEPERRRGRRIPPGPVRVENFFYHAAASFTGQVER